ncbi:ABC transporter ATP-binding protein [Halomonas salipaludis]|uniref:ABC transporter ATP-binding protein n=1 Tax=Halomonas salipaludis TaxID=2032625 RepID=UPI001140DF7C|nr:ABC transporter ATP-binding protein [Halomonas salipaludis]
MGQGRRYYLGFLWLLKEVWISNTKSFMKVVVASGIGVFLSGVSLASILYFLNLFETNGEVPFLGPVKDLLHTGVFLYLLIGALVFLIAGFYLVYLAKKLSIALGAEFQVHCAGKILTSFGGKLTVPAAYMSENRLYLELNRLQNSDARQCGMAVRRILQSVVAILVVPVGFVVMSLLSWQSTIFIIILVFLAGPVYYIINLGATKATKDHEMLSSPARKSTLDILKRGDELTEVNVKKGRPVLSAHDSGGAFIKASDAFRRRFTALAEAEYMSQCIMAIGIFVLLTYMGYLALINQVSWTFILGFLVVFRFTMAAFKQLFQTMATYSRLFPAIHRVCDFLSHGNGTGQSYSCLPDKFVVRVMKDGIYNGGRRLFIESGQTIGITTDVPVNRYTLRHYARILVGQRYSELDSLITKMVIISSDRKVLSLKGNTKMAAGNFEIDKDSIVFVNVQTLREDPGLWEELKRKEIRYLVACDKTGKGVHNRKVDIHLVGADDGKLVAAGTVDFIKANASKISNVVQSRRDKLVKTFSDNEIDEDI